MWAIKKYFVAHPDNDHQPHLLRLKTVTTILEIVLLSQIFLVVFSTAVLPASKYFAEILVNVLLDETNKSRLTVDLNPLAVSQTLTESAQMKANDMALRGYFAHIGPDGTTPWSWFKKAGYAYEYAGENLAVNFFDSKDLADAWMNSPSHRANVLHTQFTEIGIAIASGNFQGKHAVFVVEHFGKPRTPVHSLVTPAQAMAPPTVSDTADQENRTNLFERIITSPKTSINFIYFILLTIVALAFVIRLAMRDQSTHSSLLTNGAVMLIIIALALVFNELLSRSQTLIS